MSETANAAPQACSLTVLLLAACLLPGCGTNLSEDQASGRLDTQPAAAARGDIQLVTVDRDGFDAVLAKLRGQVVLVDFWATWCGPCVEQLPHTIELAERYAERGLAVVTVSIDDTGELERVSEFLRSQGAGVATNLISQFGSSPKSMETFEVTGGAVPHYKLYDRRGHLRQTFGIDPKATKQYTQQDIDSAIEQLVNE